MMGYGGWGMPGFGGYGLSGGIFSIVLWILIIVGVVWLVRSASHPRDGHDTGGAAMDILKERYAKGEISKKEFDQMKKDIS